MQQEFAKIFGTDTQPQENWNKQFDTHISRFIVAVRRKGLICDKIQEQFIAQGKLVVLIISKDGKYKEQYLIQYQGLEIIGKFLGVMQ